MSNNICELWSHWKSAFFLYMLVKILWARQYETNIFEMSFTRKKYCIALNLSHWTLKWIQHIFSVIFTHLCYSKSYTKKNMESFRSRIHFTRPWPNSTNCRRFSKYAIEYWRKNWSREHLIVCRTIFLSRGFDAESALRGYNSASNDHKECSADSFGAGNRGPFFNAILWPFCFSKCIRGASEECSSQIVKTHRFFTDAFEASYVK